ncbi:MAG: hypothetical protein KGL39_39090 [Patescibacteria group bacterium]|nr:hypothetical protein [Patescibacteria group bacterium]
MADNSPAFNPPLNRLIDEDPQIIRVPLRKMDWSARASAQPNINNSMTVRHVGNGK